MSDLRFTGIKSPDTISSSTKFSVKKSPKTTAQYVSTTIAHVTNITSKSSYHKHCFSTSIDPKDIGFVAKNQPRQPSVRGINKKCTVYVSKSERNKNINAQNSMEILKYPRVNTEKNVTPENSLPLSEKQVKVDRKNRTKVKVAESGYLDRNLEYNKEYSDDFIAFQLELDAFHKLSPTFLTKNISAAQRNSAIKNLFKYSAGFNYPSYITYQSVKISDAMIDLKNVEEDWELELINLSALWISLKRLHHFDDIPSVSDSYFMNTHEKKLQQKLISDCEKDILKRLHFEISFPDPISMVVLCLKHVNDEYPYELMYNTSLYLIDLSLLNEYFSKIPISILVIATAQISLFITVKGVEKMKYPPWHFWRSTFPKIVSAEESVPDMEVELIRKKLIRIARLSNNPESDYSVVYEKYKTSRFGKVSRLIEKRLNSLLQCEYE